MPEVGTALKVKQADLKEYVKGQRRASVTTPLAGREERLPRDPKPALTGPTTGKDVPPRLPKPLLRRVKGCFSRDERLWSETPTTGATRTRRRSPYDEGVATGVAPGSHP